MAKKKPTAESPPPPAASDPAVEGITSGDLRQIVEGALGRVPFEPPVSVEYCRAVRDAILADLPEGTRASAEVYHRHVDLVVRAHCGPTARVEIVLPLV